MGRASSGTPATLHAWTQPEAPEMDTERPLGPATLTSPLAGSCGGMHGMMQMGRVMRLCGGE